MTFKASINQPSPSVPAYLLLYSVFDQPCRQLHGSASFTPNYVDLS